MTDSPGWSERQLRGLAAIFATVVGPAYEGESERHAALAAQALTEVAEPIDLRLLQMLLAAFESVVGSVALAHGTRPFSALPRKRRERILNQWATSRIPRRRTFFQTVKRLASFFAYADPGPGGANPRWAEIAYQPAVQEPTIPSELLARAIVAVDGRGHDRLQLEAEVVVVGSGAGGGLVAARLAESGRDVLIIEAGSYVPEPELPTDELAAFDRLYLDHGMTSTTDLGIAILGGATLGGGTLVNWTTCIDQPAEIRAAWATDHGLADFEGPEADADLARLHDELGFAPPPSIGPKDRAILDGARSLGWEAALTERDAVDCGDCGSCGFGCRRGAKRSGPRLHIAHAATNGARILVGARVERVSIHAGRADGVEGTLRLSDGQSRPFAARAKTVVVAAGALRTPVVLLRSGLDHPAIGHYLRLHPAAIVAARLPGRVDMWRDTMQAARSLEFRRDGVVIESAPGHPGLIALAFPWQGTDDQAALMRESGRYAPLVGIVRDEDSGRVSVARSGRARIDYRISGRDARTAQNALVSMARLARAAGAERIIALGTPAAWHDVQAAGDDVTWSDYLARLANFDFAPNRASLFSAHQMGSARAGSDPRTSAADPWGRARRDARGSLVLSLYVADTSLFPTAVGVNPMVTVMALAARVARAVDSDLGR